MQYSPKLKIAMDEIKSILNKHDIGAFVVLHTPGHAEYLLNIDPSYSCARFEGDYLRVKAKLKEDFNGDKKAWHQKVQDTAGMLNSLSDVGGKTVLSLMEISDRVDKAVNAEHTDLGHSSQTTQNN